jgi:peptidoglycan/xylan/chitin deacetylase (PgdA/CDA1 family)
MSGVPVLLYHGLWTDRAQLQGRVAAETRYWLAAGVFEEQMHHLAACGYTAVTFEELPRHRGGALKPIVLTFDDGWGSDWRIATPILRRLDWKAELFITASWMGSPGFMTWSEVREAAAVGMGIQSHSLTHPDLARLSTEDIRYELETSKAVLEEQVGQPVHFFALPGGSGRQKEIARLAREAGYRGICTSQVGLNSRTATPFCWRRIPIVDTTSLPQLEAWVQGKGLTTLAWRRSAFRAARRLVGAGCYEWLKEKIMRSARENNDLHHSVSER